MFHGFVKPPIDYHQVAEMRDHVLHSRGWQDRYPPDFEAELLDGARFELAERVGREVLILNFFATWCGPCREEMPELERYARAHAGDQVTLLLVDVKEDRAQVERFVKELAITSPVALDRAGRIAASFEVDAFPTTIVVGVDGRIKLYELGAIANADIAFDAPVREARAALEAGKGISREGYLAALAAQPPRERSGGEQGPELTGRAMEIAVKMTCPCGCDKKVEACTCDTASRITQALAKMDFEGRSDEQVIEELNRRFCVGATPG